MSDTLRVLIEESRALLSGASSIMEDQRRVGLLPAEYEYAPGGDPDFHPNAYGELGAGAAATVMQSDPSKRFGRPEARLASEAVANDLARAIRENRRTKSEPLWFAHKPRLELHAGPTLCVEGREARTFWLVSPGEYPGMMRVGVFRRAELGL